MATGASPGLHDVGPGDRLGRYELIGRLAIGGMAELFLARATGIEGFERLCVVKRILPQFAQNAEFVTMFLDEARLAGRLHHPNIAQVHDIGMVGESFFFTMEYVHGEDLRRIMEHEFEGGTPVPLDQAINILCNAAAGLHYAHEKTGPDGSPLGIVHRDVSPSNILVTYEGGVKIVDFGIAKASSRQSETRAGTIKGKFAYMSPENCRGEEIDRRSDVFALGILLYELTTATRPFGGKNEFAVLNHIANRDAARPSTVVPGYPAELERIVMKALARDREQRYATAEELQLDLEAFAREQRLVISTIALAKYMHSVFGDKIEAWQQARRTGKSLADHLTMSLVITIDDADSSLRGQLAPDQRTASSPLRARRRSRRLAAAVALFVVAMVAVLAVVAGRSGGPAGAAKRAADDAVTDVVAVVPEADAGPADAAPGTAAPAKVGPPAEPAALDAGAAAPLHGRPPRKRPPPIRRGWDPNSPLPPP